jgi:hypothetical protein
MFWEKSDSVLTADSAVTGDVQGISRKFALVRPIGSVIRDV